LQETLTGRSVLDNDRRRFPGRGQLDGPPLQLGKFDAASPDVRDDEPAFVSPIVTHAE
jgi:hypothetical protein